MSPAQITIFVQNDRMILSRWRFALIFLFLGMGVSLHVWTSWSAAWTLYLAAVILLLTHLFFGNVWAAFRLLQHGKPQEAARLLDTVWRPGWLIPRNRAYYHFARGILLLQAEERTLGEKHLREALNLGLFRANDRALAQLNLAHLHYVQHQYAAARAALQAAAAEEPTDLMIKDQLAKMQNALDRVQN